MKPEPKLEPLACCPFCNGVAGVNRWTSVKSNRTFWRVACRNDGECPIGPHEDFETEAEAIAAWNTRTPASEPTEAQVEAAAIALHNIFPTTLRRKPARWRWEEQMPEYRDHVRYKARAALKAGRTA